MYDYILHRKRRHFCCYYLEAFSAAEMLKNHVNDYFKISGKEMIKMSKKGDYVRFKNYERKIESSMIYANFESFSMPENNWKENPDEPKQAIL